MNGLSKLAAQTVSVFLGLSALLIASPSPSSATSTQPETLFTSTGTHFYRVPSIVTIRSSQHVIAFAEERLRNLNRDWGDINIVYRVSINGENWGPVRRICELGVATCGNPTAVVDQDTDKIHLFMNSSPANRCQIEDDVGKGGCIGTYRVGDRKVRYFQATVSGDSLVVLNADSNGHPQDLTATLQDSGTKFDLIGPGTGIQLEKPQYDGRLIIPALHRNFISDDGGATWRQSQQRISNITSESTIVELDKGHILRNDRPVYSYWKNVAKRRLISESTDGGDNFSPPAPDPKLLDPRVAGSMLRYSQGNIFFSNCATSGEVENQRSRVKLRIRKLESDVNGVVTWDDGKLIDPLCGYSSMTKTRDFYVGILYERVQPGGKKENGNPQDLIFQKFKLAHFN